MRTGLRSRLRRLRALTKPPNARTPSERFLLAGHNELLLRGLATEADATVLDVGGFQGAYAASVVDRYGCHVHVFEPVAAFTETLMKRFAGDDRVSIHPYGLAANNRTGTFRMDNDATGENSLGPSVEVALRSVAEIFAKLPESVDVMAVNIEGGEYELLPAMYDAGLFARVKRMDIQFHDVGPDTWTHVDQCRGLMAQTHEQTWCFDLVWESWLRTGS